MDTTDPFWHMLIADVLAAALILVPVFRNYSKQVEWRRDVEHKLERLDEKQLEIKSDVDKMETESKQERKHIYSRLDGINQTLAAICQKLGVECR